MADYIVCHKKRNAPRLNVRICQEKCLLKDECEEYLTYIKVPFKHKQAFISPRNTPVVLATS